ncbi:undecaprenyl-phosphate glucose phosphotransferase [Pectobacterium aquaticum]|uniref:undecaprenyl-phosphate glucose phosphotransferase n=1 Tax=Pectobacterium aquaticum TaxID=2204145 RepID=UPI000E245759|nr:undecaprenyl-phosphate glucose phosphotransferase [Pectobacterium aquaticum]UEM38260.1 undecaprenyl-phosphate glucose phosphotransferase [Pectobacterium aquaticum]
MIKRQGDFIYSNASIISILQRVSDIAVILSSTLFFSFFIYGDVFLKHWLIALISLSTFQMVGGITDFYRSWRGVNFRLEMYSLVRNWLLSIIFSAGVLSVIPSLFIDFTYYLTWFFVSLIGFCLARISIRIIVRYLRAMGYNQRKIVIVGDSVAGGHLIRSIMNAPWVGLNVIGYYMPDENSVSDTYNTLNVKWLGGVDDLITSARNGDIDKVYITLPMNESKLINHILRELSDTTCTVLLVPDIFTFNVLRSRSETVNGISVISLYDSPMSGINRIIKRLEDIIISLLIILMISPILLIIAILIKLTSPGPVIFKQMRYGLDGKAIEVWKFRSMTVMENGDDVIQARKNDPRLTPIGGFLRKTSLDELPQFFNVVLGDMSIVGPRPHAIYHNEQYRKLIDGYMLRHKMKPGITGWAQINGWRGETDTLEKMEKRIEFDLEYIQSWSVWLDMKIIFFTIFKGFVNKSAY